LLVIGLGLLFGLLFEAARVDLWCGYLALLFLLFNFHLLVFILTGGGGG